MYEYSLTDYEYGTSTERICGTVAPVRGLHHLRVILSYDQVTTPYDRTKRIATVQEDGHTNNGMYDYCRRRYAGSYKEISEEIRPCDRQTNKQTDTHT